MSRDKIISDLWSSAFLNELLSKLTSDHPLKEDLKSELFIIICTWSDKKIKEAHKGNYLHYQVVAILKNQFHSNTSPFHKKFRKFNHEELTGLFGERFNQPEESPTSDDLITDIKKIVETFDLVDRELFKMYWKYDRYDRWLGDLKDQNCLRPQSSLRKIEKKLELKPVPGQKRVTISRTTIAKSLNGSLEKIRKELKENGWDL